MSLSELLADLESQGITIGTENGRIWYSPRSAVTPALADRMKGCETDLLTMFRRESEPTKPDPLCTTALWKSTTDQLEGDPLFPPDLLEALRTADVELTDDRECMTPERSATNQKPSGSN